jgi:LemA protein
MKKGWIIALVVAAILVFMVAGSYNNMVTMNENIKSQWSQVENQLQRRADLIPNLVATVKGYAIQEQKIYGEIAAARSRLINANGAADKAAANDELTGALSRLLVVVENYPNLKSDANFRQLQDELAGTENRLAVARKDYNDSVRLYNSKIRAFPTVIWARLFGFGPAEYFQAQEGAKSVPQVDFNQ